MPISIPANVDRAALAEVARSGKLGSYGHRPKKINPIRSNNPLELPYTIAIDTREQIPYQFADYKADAHQQYRQLIVPTQRSTLPQGDYSIINHEHEIAIERKSHEDLVNTLGQGRERFERELDRLSTYHYAAVVVEAEWSEILYNPPAWRGLTPKTVYRSIIAFQLRYPNIHWWMVPDRSHGEVTTLRILQRWWKVREDAIRDIKREEKKRNKVIAEIQKRVSRKHKEDIGNGIQRLSRKRLPGNKSKPMNTGNRG